MNVRDQVYASSDHELHGDSAATRWRWAATSRGTGLLALTVLVTLALASSAQAAQAPVPLGTNDSFAVLGATTVTNTGPTVVNGDLGVSPGTAVTGFPPGTVNGTIHSADAVAGQAQSDLTTAYNDAAGRACDVNLTGQDLGGKTLTSGAYCFSSSAGLTGTLTLDGQGDPQSVFIFQIGSTLTTAPGSSVNLINGAQACNVYWQVGSSATLDTTTSFVGNILALTSITANTGATVEDGRLLARNGAVTMDTNTITRAVCAIPPPPPPPPPPPRPPDHKPPHVRVSPHPKHCTSDNFTIHVLVKDKRSGVKYTVVFLDGNRIRRSTHKRFAVRIRAKGLDPGRHVIKVVAVDNSGNRRKKKRHFKQCAPAKPPPFTG